MHGNRVTFILLLLFIAHIAGCARTAMPGIEAFKRGDYATAVNDLTSPAKKGNIEAQWLLGAAYANADPPLQNLAAAEKWTGMAANRGHVNAMVDMAKLNLFYKAVTDEKTAAQWYRMAADRQHPEAQFMIGLFHYSGEKGFVEDKVQARMWWMLAAERGKHPLALKMLQKTEKELSREERAEAARLADEWKAVP